MTTREKMETRLLQAVEVTPSADALRRLDERVARAMAASPTAMHRRGFFTRRVLLRPLALVAAFVLLTGAVVGAMSLLERLAESTPGWRTAYDRAEALGVRQTDAGYTITLDRAYADLNQVMAFFTVESVAGLEAPESSDGFLINHFVIFDADLRDPAGRIATSRIAATDIEPGLAAAVESFQYDTPTTRAGTYELTISSIGYGADGPVCVSPCVNDEIAGTWRFSFALPEPAGTVVSADASATVGQATLHLTELRVSPTMITARIAMHVDGSPVAYWTFIPSDDDLRHEGASYGLWSGRHILVEAPFEVGPEMEFSTIAGTDDPGGTWEIVIPELDYGMSNEEQIHLAGPWTLTVTVP